MSKEAAAKEILDHADGLHSAAIRLLRAVRHVDQQSGLSPARLSALSVLVFAGPLPVGRLAAAEGVRSPTMTGIVNGLVDDGLAERRPAAGDLRSVEVAVTGKGRRLFNAARRRRVEAVAGLIGDLPGTDLETLEHASAVLRRLLEERKTNARSTWARSARA
ncbi:MAG TPA: MarR family transcriptional regulator [Actinomycetota bacterium]|nr:MarR family transcriptional regulator [Actinomycetota bacterium]